MREGVRAGTVAALAILALGLGAATLDSTVTSDRGAGTGPEAGPAEGTGGEGRVPGPSTGPGQAFEVPFLDVVTVLILVILVLAVVSYVTRNWREAVVALVGVSLVLGLVYVSLNLVGAPASPSSPVASSGNATPAGGGGETGVVQPAVPSWLVGLVVVVGGAGTILAFFLTRSGDDGTETAPDEDVTDAAAVGRAAGRAVDRLEADTDTDDVDNEVYRTWREMTDLLEVDRPATSTPGEFAEAAVAVGLGREDVDELTRLFEDVRYGDVPATEEAERRAADVFGRIEARYADDADDGGRGGRKTRNVGRGPNEVRRRGDDR
jgi:hypothetical protein